MRIRTANLCFLPPYLTGRQIENAINVTGSRQKRRVTKEGLVSRPPLGLGRPFSGFLKFCSSLSGMDILRHRKKDHLLWFQNCLNTDQYLLHCYVLMSLKWPSMHNGSLHVRSSPRPSGPLWSLTAQNQKAQEHWGVPLTAEKQASQCRHWSLWDKTP